MKKVKYTNTLLFIGICFMFLAGCANQEQSKATLSSKEEKLIWTSTREKSFGEYEYKNMTSEKEVIELLTDKFKVSIPPIYDLSNRMFAENTFLKSYANQSKTYDILIHDNALNFTQTIYYGTDDIPQLAKSVIRITYIANTETKKVKTTNQQVNITTVTSESPKFYESLPKLSKDMATALSFTNSNLDETIEKSFAAYPDHYEQKNMESVNLITQKKSDDSLEKNMELFYNNNNVVTEWNTTISYE